MMKQKRLLQFLLVVIFAVSFAFYISRVLPKGGVWNNHLAAGHLLVAGSIPKLPAYPMWGYSLLAGILEDNITFFQGILIIIVCVYWYRSILGFPNTVYPPRKLTKIMINPIFVATVLIPFILLGLSYFSNSMTYILVFWGTWLLYLAVEGKERSIGYYATSGLLIGLGFNFRSDVLMLGILLFFALTIYGIIKDCKGYYLKMAIVFFIPLVLAILPWIVYTSFTVKQPLLTSTNGGAVMYLGLGVLPNNPWSVVDSDGYVGKIAAENNLGSAWSADANKYFKLRYLQSIQEHPRSFAKRVILGWRHMLTQGLWFPSFRSFFSLGNTRDEVLFDYLNERLKLAFGLNVNEEEWEEYNALGIGSNDLLFRHYTVVVLEYITRLMYLGIFILLLSACILLSLRTKFNSFISFIFAAHLVFLLFVAGFIQALPRHTILLLPISLSTMIVLTCKPTRQEKG